MITRSGIFSKIPYFLTLLILCQSCNIYHSKNISLDEAVKTESKVKVKTTSDQRYVFKRIESKENLFYGLAGRNSKAGQKLVKDTLSKRAPDNLVKIPLNENLIQEINSKDKALSTIVSIVLGVSVFFLAFVGTLSMVPPMI